MPYTYVLSHNICEPRLVPIMGANDWLPLCLGAASGTVLLDILLDVQSTVYRNTEHPLCL